MKKTYRSLLTSIENLIVSIEKTKSIIGENYSLIQKRSLLKRIKWDKDTQNSFDKYWKLHFGKKISNKGHKLYEAINGIHHKNYIPDFLFATKVEPFFNPYFYKKFYSDKSLTEILYDKNPKVVFPKTILVKCSGIYYDSERKIIGKTEAEKILNSISGAVIKPIIGGSTGQGVMICNFNEGYDKEKNYSISRLLDDNNKNFIVQEIIKQHESNSIIYPNSVNTIRPITYIVDGKIYCSDITIRIGCGGRAINNADIDGLLLGIKDDGKLLKYAYKLGNPPTYEKYDKHPDTNFIFENHTVVGIDKIIEIAKELHGFTPHIGMISWDFIITSDGKPAIIEANYRGQSAWYPQITHGKPIFGNQTERILELIRKSH
ncbi:MAG: sugar-transfer associated ATP-grasp domain-containing protein [Petrimonas sp.]|jgi:hypothetical protein